MSSQSYAKRVFRNPLTHRASHLEQAPAGFFLSRFQKITPSLSERSIAILSSRFGIDGKAPMTLEGIGRGYTITRERVRQILSSLFEDLESKKFTALFEEVAKKIEWTLRNASGILKEQSFFEVLGKHDAREEGALRFFLAALPHRFLLRETRSIVPSVVLHDFSFEDWNTVNKAVKGIFQKRGSSMTEAELLSALDSVSFGRTFSASEVIDYISVSRDVKKSPFGRWGLPTWPDITPRGTRERAFLVVEAEGSPLHFRDIARRIDEYNLQPSGRTTHPQTVHNELIKDERFVLIGRGLYALADWGYTRGTVRDVIQEVLERKKKPLSRSEVIAEVLKVRKVKESTIVINLNSFFHRVGKGMYDAAKKSGK